jgi:uncharacterized protein YceH (UPF0502 family)
VPTKGAYTPEELRQRTKRKIKDYERAKKITKELGIEKKAIERINRAEKNLKKLNDSDFPEIVIAKARRNPDGKIALTLKYGPEKAKDILLARARRLKRMIMMRRRR